MHNMHRSALVLTCAVAFTSIPGSSQPAGAAEPSRNRQAVSGPTHTMNEALAAGATTIISLQPVPPKTVPASNYPIGTVIMNETIYLGSVPARVWLEGRVTGWAPDVPFCVQTGIDAEDLDGDGGGYRGDRADCNGAPVVGAGDLFPAIVPCTTSNDCRAQVAGRTSPCGSGNPWVCAARPSFFPPGGNVCAFGFNDQCDPKYVVAGLSNICAFDLASINTRWVVALNEPDDVGLLDFAPSLQAPWYSTFPPMPRGVTRSTIGRNRLSC